MKPEDCYYRSGYCPRRRWLWFEESFSRPSDPYGPYPGSFTVRSLTRAGIARKAARVLAPYYGSMCLSQNEPASGGGVRTTGRYHLFKRDDSDPYLSRDLRPVEYVTIGPESTR